MSRREQGAFVISWSQTELDGLETPPISAMGRGSAWSWRGQASRVDGLETNPASGWSGQNPSAAGIHNVSSLRPSLSADVLQAVQGEGPFCARFTVTNGAQTYSAKVIRFDMYEHLFVVFEGVLPPRETELWVEQETVSALPDQPIVVDDIQAANADAGFACGDEQAPDSGEVVWMPNRLAAQA